MKPTIPDALIIRIAQRAMDYDASVFPGGLGRRGILAWICRVIPASELPRVIEEEKRRDAAWRVR